MLEPGRLCESDREVNASHINAILCFDTPCKNKTFKTLSQRTEFTNEPPMLLSARKSANINHASALRVFILCCMSTRLCLILQWRAESWQAFHPKIAKLSTFREMQKNSGTTKTACPLLSNHTSLNPNLCPAAVDPIRLVLFYFFLGGKFGQSHMQVTVYSDPEQPDVLFFFCGPATFIQRCSALKSHQTPDFSRSLVGKAKKK